MSDFLPEHILVTILTRLPIPDLVRCMCVCKQWHSLITSPNFISSSSSSSEKRGKPSPLFVLVCHARGRNVCTLLSSDPQQQNPNNHIYKTFPFPLDCPSLEIVGSVHGLLCLYDHRRGNTYIWNPSIFRYLQLPVASSLFKDDDAARASEIGFGFDSIRSDFKVVRVTCSQEDDDQLRVHPLLLPPIPRVGVYTLRDRSWRSVAVAGMDWAGLFLDSMWSRYFMNGATHWLASSDARDQGNFRRRNLIVLFDMAEETIKRMELPQELLSQYRQMEISEMKGLLAVFRHHYPAPDDVKCYDIWAMKEYGMPTSWTRMYKIGTEDLGLERVLGFYGRDGNEVLLARESREEGVSDQRLRLVLYDPDNRVILKDLGVDGSNLFAFSAATYAESLVLLDKGSGAVSYEMPSTNNKKLISPG